MMAERWTSADIPDLSGRVAVVTGANSGLGLETSRELALHGAHVVMACRDVARGEEAAQAILMAAPGARVEVAALDLASLDSARQFAEVYGAAHDGLDLLVNNAGVMAIPRRQTADGFEMQFGTNHLGHFALTGRLLPLLLARPGARVVTVSSLNHRSGVIPFDDLQRERDYDPWQAYAQSKLANLLFAFELQRRIAAASVALASMAAHPGYSATNLQGVGPRMNGSRAQERLFAIANRVLAQPASMGALPILYAATAPDALGGAYYGPGGLGETRGYPKRVTAARRAHSLEDARRLWEVSEQLTGVTYPILDRAAAGR